MCKPHIVQLLSHIRSLLNWVTAEFRQSKRWSVLRTDPSPADGLFQKLHHVLPLDPGAAEAFSPADQDALHIKKDKTFTSPVERVLRWRSGEILFLVNCVSDSDPIAEQTAVCWLCLNVTPCRFLSAHRGRRRWSPEEESALSAPESRGIHSDR